VLDHGRIVESGHHEDLIQAGGRYSALVSRDAELATSAATVAGDPALAGAPVVTRYGEPEAAERAR
jgi:hypothetical protein